jgi:putative FmdB family regulatory protein
MPIYEYVCDDCGEHYEKLVMSKSQAIECPKCASRKRTVQLSVFSAARKGSHGANGTSASSSMDSSFGGGCGCNPHGCGCH